MVRLTGAVAIITGTSSGIGEVTTKRLTEKGAKVVLADRNDEKLQRVAGHLSKGDYLITPINVMHRDNVDALIENTIAKFGKIDIFVNCAGTSLSSEIVDYKIDDWNKMIDMNIKGLLYGLNVVLPRPEEQSSGRIVNMTFISGFEVNKTDTLHSTAKPAVLRVVETLEKELAQTGVKSTSVLPGVADTPMTEGYDLSDRKKLDPESIVDAVIYVVTQPAHTSVSEVVVRPV